MRELIFRGLKLQTDSCKYLWVHKGETSMIRHDSKGVLNITWTNSDSKTTANLLGLDHIGKSQELPDMPKPELIQEVTISINGLKLKKLTWDTHIIKIVIVQDSESKVS